MSSDLCQLCALAPGTLLHRHVCPATRPHDGWPSPPATPQRDLPAISEARRHLLATRGLVVAKLRLPRRPPGDTFTWVTPPPDVLPLGAQWFIDGSVFDSNHIATLSAGFGIVILGESGELPAS